MRRTPGATCQAPGSVQFTPESGLIRTAVGGRDWPKFAWWFMRPSSTDQTTTRDQGQVLGHDDAARSVTDGLDRVDQAHRGGDHPGHVVVTVLAVVVEVDLHHRLAEDLHPVAAVALSGLRPRIPFSGALRRVGPGDVVELHPRDTVDRADDPELDGAHRSRRYVAGVDRQVDLGGDPLVVLLEHRVELQLQPSGDLPDDRPPGRGEHAGLPEHRRVVHRTTEAVEVLHHHGLVVGRVVADLTDHDLVDPLG